MCRILKNATDCSVKFLSIATLLVLGASAIADHGGTFHIDLSLSVPATSSTGNYTATWTTPIAMTLQERFNGGSYSTAYYGAAGSFAFSNKPSGTYQYRIQWYLCAFSCSYYYTLPETIVVSAAPETPTGLTGPSTDNDGSYTISWNSVSGATSYELEEAVNSGSWSQVYSGPATNLAVNGKSDGAYSYRVKACAGGSNCSAWSAPWVTTVAVPPAVPAGLTGPSNDPDGNYPISWNASVGSTSYTLEEQANGGAWIAKYTGSSMSYAFSGNGIGTYGYRVKGCNGSTNCSAWSATHTVLVTSGAGGVAAPPSPASNADPGQASSAQSDTIGTTAGNFRVDESGAATYSIPIAAAAGTAGVAPQVSLNYSSSSGNGIAGLGWSVGGLSAITRCRQTYGQDRDPRAIAWTADDRFCIDGQRLLLHPSTQTNYGAVDTTYRTEIDGGAIITIRGNSNGEPDYFEVKRKDGSTSYYGKSPDDTANDSAKIGDGPGKTLTWAIRHFKDSIGNPIWFEYIDNGLGHRIDRIRWAFGLGRGPVSGAAAYLEFAYDTNREDKRSGYVAGSLFKNESILTEIRSYNAGNLIRQYNLAYNQNITADDKLNRLTSIQECAGATCLPATTFDWRVPVSGQAVLASFTHSMGGTNLSAFQPADINGDGLMDLVWLEGAGANKTMKYAFSNGTSYVNQSFSGGGLGLSVATGTIDPLIRPIDYNLDGRQDVAYFDQNDYKWKIVLAEPFGDGGWRLNTAVITTPLSSRIVTFIDTDSNGTTDAVYPFGSGMRFRRLELDPGEPDDSSPRRYHFGDEFDVAGAPFYSVSVNAALTVAPDLDGDGQVDFIIFSQDWICEGLIWCLWIGEQRAAMLSKGFTGASPSVADYYIFPTSITVDGVALNHTPDLDKMQAVDINGDGLSDVFYAVGDLSSAGEVDATEYALQINHGDGTFDYQRVTDASLLDDIANPQLVDWNMDGHPDLLWKDKSVSAGSVRARYWNPDTGELDPVITISPALSTSDIESVSYFDVNGDGAPDIVSVNSGGTIGLLKVAIRQDAGEIANVAVNRVESIANGLSAETRITYEPLSYSNHYDRLEVSSTPQTQTVCVELGDPNQRDCWPELVQVADKGAFYTKINGPWELPVGAQMLGKNSPVIEMSGPMYVVTDVVGDAPAAGTAPGSVNVNATSSISYHYGEARIQAAGRGFLGFKRLKTVDHQSGVETTTTYRQDWPFIGSPMFTEVVSATGNTLSNSTTDWEIVEWTAATAGDAAANGTAYLGSLHVLQKSSGEETYDLVGNGDSQGSLLRTVSTENSYDSEGNATKIIVTMRHANGGEVKKVDTDNTYFNDGNFTLFEARLKDTIVNTSYNSAPAPQRKSAFTYYSGGANRGLLQTEVIEPGTAYTLATTHSYDSFGNRIRSATTGGTETRCNNNTVAFNNRGRYADTSFDCLGRILSTVTARNSMGSPTSVRNFTDVNGTDFYTTSISYSTLGREYYRYKDDGSQASKYMSLDLTFCPAGTAFRSISTDVSGAASAECFDVLGRSVRAMSTGFDGQWNAQDTEYDNRGNVKRKSAPFDLTSGSQVAPYWTTMSYDLLGRVTLTVLPDSSTGSTSYSGFVTTTTNDLGQSRSEEVNELGEVIKVTDNLNGITLFSYDHQGNMLSMTSPANNATLMTYDLVGRKLTMNDPDKGLWSYSYNAFGELIQQTDAKGQVQTMTYDGLGRMATRIDKLSGGTTEGSTTWVYDAAADGLGQLASVQDSTSNYLKSVLYDSLGRADEVITNFDGGIYYEKTTFDQYGRVFQVFDAAGDGSYTDQGVVNNYNAFGYLESVSDAALVSGIPKTTYRKVLSMNARGQVTYELRGIDNTGGGSTASVSTSYVYSSTTGRLLNIDGVNASAQDVQDLQYTWDSLGNLSSRKEFSGSKNLTESFQYDGLNRLNSQAVSGQGTVTLSYDVMGNITNKSDLGSYSYGAGSAGPHAVTSAGGSTYAYDANGNNTTGDGRTILYTSFDKAHQISKGGHVTSFEYGPDRARYKRVDSGSTGTRTMYYIGNVEIIFQTNGDQDRKRYIAGVAIETIHFGSDSVEDYRETHYLHKDHLGSLDVITDSTGTIVNDMSFDAWGARRAGNDWTTWTPTQQTSYDYSLTNRGFTGHEMLDEVGIIHMNGRIYDQKLGRFLQADPIIQDPMNTQSLNRYSYVWNNPLNATDPSGYFVFSLMVAAAFAGAEISVAMIASFIFAGFADALAAGASFQDALLAGLSSGAFTFAGSSLFPGAAGFGFNGPTARYVATIGAIGGISAVLQGGKFGDGFRSAGIGTITGGISGSVSNKYDFGKLRQGIVRSVAAGTASALTGGKFANGAAYSAFSATLASFSEHSLLQSAGGREQVQVHSRTVTSTDGELSITFDYKDTRFDAVVDAVEDTMILDLHRDGGDGNLPPGNYEIALTVDAKISDYMVPSATEIRMNPKNFADHPNTIAQNMGHELVHIGDWAAGVLSNRASRRTFWKSEQKSFAWERRHVPHLIPTPPFPKVLRDQEYNSINSRELAARHRLLGN